jgi:hypothetical protein
MSNAPYEDLSAGMSVTASHTPLVWMKVSSCGRVVLSSVARSMPDAAGFAAAGVGAGPLEQEVKAAHMVATQVSRKPDIEGLLSDCESGADLDGIVPHVVGKPVKFRAVQWDRLSGEILAERHP